MIDPLAPYPPMMSTRDLAHFLGIGNTTAWEEMQKMPHTTVGNGRKYKTRRVSKEEVRKRYNLAEPKPSHLRAVK